jgi:ribosomal protein L19
MSDEKKKYIEHDEFCVSLNISGDDLEPDEISRLLGASPTEACRLGDAIPLRNHTFTAKSGSWSINTERSTRDIEEQLTELFAKLNSNTQVWSSLTNRYRVELFCGVFLSWFGHGFSMSPKLHRLLADRNLEITFDIYDEYDHGS